MVIAMSFLEQILCNQKKNKVRIATVVQGENIGKKSFYYNGAVENTNTEDFFQLLEKEESKKIQEEQSIIIEKNGQKVFIESLQKEPHMVICGGGHVSIPVIKMAKMLEFRVTVLEDRPSFADNARRAGADEVICNSFVQGLHQIEGNENTYFVIVTRGHRYDVDCLTEILQKDHAYIGMIGSKKRVKSVKELMEEKGFSKELIESIYSPIGLKIGAEMPSEIAVSIMAEIIQVKNTKKGNIGYTREILQFLEEWKENKVPVAIVTIISRKGSAPRGIGTKMLVTRDGRMVGTIGGGCAESAIQGQAIQCMEKGESKLVFVDMTGKEAEEDGMVCGGVIEVFIDCYSL